MAEGPPSLLSTTHTLSSAGKALLLGQSAKQAKWVDTNRRAFLVAAPILRNSVSLEACLTPSLVWFR